MFARTEQSPFLANQRHVAVADGAEEHELSVANGESVAIPAGSVVAERELAVPRRLFETTRDHAVGSIKINCRPFLP